MSTIYILKSETGYDCAHVSIGTKNAFIKTWPENNTIWSVDRKNPNDARDYFKNAPLRRTVLEACNMVEEKPLPVNSPKWGQVFAKLRKINWDQQNVGMLSGANKSKHYSEWSKRWSDVRKNVGAIDEVIQLLKTKPQGWQRKALKEGFGYRNKHQEGSGPRGEQKIEKQLFEKYLITVEHNDMKCPFVALYHKMPLANQRSEQRIADAFGLLLHNREIHPLMVEVKVDANDCWYALVENLQQVIMARANPKFIKDLLAKRKMPEKTGVWGMVLAPREYYESDKTIKEALKLLKALAKGTEQSSPTKARIAFAAYDNLNNHIIKVIHSNWQ